MSNQILTQMASFVPMAPFVPQLHFKQPASPPNPFL